MYLLHCKKKKKKVEETSKFKATSFSRFLGFLNFLLYKLKFACDTEDWSYDAENSALITVRNKLHSNTYSH